MQNLSKRFNFYVEKSRNQFVELNHNFSEFLWSIQQFFFLFWSIECKKMENFVIDTRR